jgi:serine protease Do/serine protease DegQ
MKTLVASALLAVSCAVQSQPVGLPTRDGLPTLAPILEKAQPAVVNIAAVQKSPEEQNPLLRDPFFRRFFGRPQQEEPQAH